MSRLDSSFASFINSNETLGDDLTGYLEVIFHNEALFRVLGDVDAKDLQEFISKPVFFNDDVSLNLISAAQNKYSANVLAQPYKFKQLK